MPRAANTVNPATSKYSTLVQYPLENKEPIGSVTLYIPFEVEQITLAEYSSYLASRAYLQMCKLPYSVEHRSNAEFLGSHGLTTNVPFFKVDNFLGSEFKHLVKTVEDREVSLSTHLSEDKSDDMKAFLSLVHDMLTYAELYFTFMVDEVYETVTKPRISAAYPYLLGRVQSFRKRRQVSKILQLNSFKDSTPEQVLGKVDHLCAILEKRLIEQPYLSGDKPTELDAVLFGHLYAILTTPFPNTGLVDVVKKYDRLVAYCQKIDTECFKR